jgi:hypothetical protein
MKNSNDTIENRSRNLPFCSAVPQPTAPPRVPVKIQGKTEVIRERRVPVPILRQKFSTDCSWIEPVPPSSEVVD